MPSTTSAGVAAGSIALLGFGIDSVIESLSGAVLLWCLWANEANEDRERRALRLVGWSFVILAAYVAWDAGLSFRRGEHPAPSRVGIALSVATVILMPMLARKKRQVAARKGSRALDADSRQSSVCAFLSAILLGELVLYAWVGWWWADPLAALAMAPIIAREGLEALRGKTCTDCQGALKQVT